MRLRHRGSVMEWQKVGVGIVLSLLTWGASAQHVYWDPVQRLTCDPEERVFTPSVVKGVLLDGRLESEAVVRIRIVGGSATFNVDYEGLLVETLRFRPSLVDFDGQLWGVGVFDDDLEEPWETIEIEMEVSGGATLRGPSRARITILDDETRQPEDFNRCFQEIENSVEFDLNGRIDRWSRDELRAPFRVEVFNNGSRSREGLVVQQVVPGFTQFLPAESSPGWVCPDGRGAGRVCRFELGSLEGHSGRQIDFVTSIDAATAETTEIFSEAVLEDTASSEAAARSNPAAAKLQRRDQETTLLDLLCSLYPCDEVALESPLEVLARLCALLLEVVAGRESIAEASTEGSLVAVPWSQIGATARSLFRLRDRVLLEDSGGRRALELLDEHAGAMWNAARRDPGYVARVGQSIARWMPALESLVEGAGEAIVTPEMADDFRAFFEDLYPDAGEAFRAEASLQLERLDPSSWSGRPVREALRSFRRLRCEAGEQSLCLSGGRFRVDVQWEDFQGGAGRGRRVQLTEDTGAFWFFDEANTELIVKVLDARSVNGHFWVFYGALSNVPYRIVVTDTETGDQREYSNPAGRFASSGDTTAFAGSSSPSVALASRERQDEATGDGRPVPGVELVQVGFPNAGHLRGRRDIGKSGCAPGAQTLCLAEGRFEVSVVWSDFEGGSGPGRSVAISEDTGAFWFFDEENLELVVKVLDARAINDQFWVFYGALSNVAYQITIRDTVSGAERTYDNPSGTFASVGDTEAFDG